MRGEYRGYLPRFVDCFCERCGLAFRTRRDWVERGWGRFCSKSCAQKWKHGDPALRVWTLIDQTGGPDACWPWLGRRVKGYGVMNWEGKPCYATRLVWFLTQGCWPENALHTCDHPACCNPVHLYDGTKAQNAQDMARRGRAHAQQPGAGVRLAALRKARGSHRGERNGSARLTAGQVAEIRRRYRRRGTDNQVTLAREFGVAHSTIGRIVRGEKWV